MTGLEQELRAKNKMLENAIEETHNQRADEDYLGMGRSITQLY